MDFRLAVLNPGGRDAEQHFGDAAEPPTKARHAPVNFHAYAACTHGTVFRDPKRAIASGWPVLLLLRGDFRATERALRHLKYAKRKVAVALKETGAHQIAQQMADHGRFARLRKILQQSDGCIAAVPEAAELLRHISSRAVAFIPTPYPIHDPHWDWSVDNRAGIFVGTREFRVPSRNHFAALIAASRLSDATQEPVTVFNTEGRRGARIIAQLGFRKIRIHHKSISYRAYLGEVSRHKIVFQLDRSRVPGQVAGDALLCRSVCVGGDGAIDRIAFPETCGDKRSDTELMEIALRLLTNETERRAIAQRAIKIAQTKMSFDVAREALATFFANL